MCWRNQRRYGIDQQRAAAARTDDERAAVGQRAVGSERVAGDDIQGRFTGSGGRVVSLLIVWLVPMFTSGNMPFAAVIESAGTKHSAGDRRQCAIGDGRAAGVGVDAAERDQPGADFRQRERAGVAGGRVAEHAVERRGTGAVVADRQRDVGRAIVGHLAAAGQRADILRKTVQLQRAAEAEHHGGILRHRVRGSGAERAAADRGRTGIRVRAAEDERAGVGERDAAGAADTSEMVPAEVRILGAAPSTSIVAPPEPSAMPRFEFSVNVPVASSVPPLIVIFVAAVRGTWPSSLSPPADTASDEISSVVPVVIVVPPVYELPVLVSATEPPLTSVSEFEPLSTVGLLTVSNPPPPPRT